MMISKDLKNASLNALIDEFVASALRQEEKAMEAEHDNEEDYEVVNREIRWGWDVRDEILGRGADGVAQLLALVSYPKMQVILNAAKALKDVEPVRARQIIEAVANASHPPQSANAGMFLLSLDKMYPWQQQ